MKISLAAILTKPASASFDRVSSEGIVLYTAFAARRPQMQKLPTRSDCLTLRHNFHGRGRCIGLAKQCREVLGHLRAEQWLVSTGMTGGAVDFCHVPTLTLTACREYSGEWLHVLIVEIARHADTVPSSHTLRRAGLP